MRSLPVNGVDLTHTGPPRPDMHLGQYVEAHRVPDGTYRTGPAHTTLFITGRGVVDWPTLTRSPARWRFTRPGGGTTFTGTGRVIVIVPSTGPQSLWQLAIYQPGLATRLPTTQGDPTP